MAQLTLKDVLDSLLKAVITAIEANPALKGSLTFISEIVARSNDDQFAVLAGADPGDLSEAISQIDIGTTNTALALAGISRIEEIISPLQAAIENEFQESRKAIDRMVRLVETLQLETSRSHQIAGSVRVAADWAASIAPPTPQIRKLAESLAAIVDRFDRTVDVESLSEEDAFDVRLARATLANARQSYSESLQTVTAKDEQAHTDRLIEVLQVRGDAFYGLHEWEEALARYERILAHRPDRWGTRNDLAICFVALGRLREALRHFDAAVEHFADLVNVQGRTELANDLAMAHNNRGTARSDLGRLDEAIEDFDKAIAIYARLVEDEGRTELANELAIVRRNRDSAA